MRFVKLGHIITKLTSVFVSSGCVSIGHRQKILYLSTAALWDAAGICSVFYVRTGIDRRK